MCFITDLNLAGFYYKLRLNQCSLDNVGLDIGALIQLTLEQFGVWLQARYRATKQLSNRLVVDRCAARRSIFGA